MSILFVVTDDCSYVTEIESAVLIINDLLLIRHYSRLSVAVRRDWYQM